MDPSWIGPLKAISKGKAGLEDTVGAGVAVAPLVVESPAVGVPAHALNPMVSNKMGAST
jgi:hypothetical protein